MVGRSSLYDKIKAASKNRGLSINKFLIATLTELHKGKEKLEYHDMDDLFETWSEEEFEHVEEAEAESRVINDEIWK